jgi:arginyl-tRNA synthetase
MKEKVIAILKKSLNLSEDKIKNLLEIPKDEKLGDYALPCFTFAKEMKKNPVEIAKELALRIKSDKIIEKAEAVGPYVNVFLNKQAFAEEIINNILKNEDYGSSGEGKGKEILIEHTSINPNAAPHVGRARNALIGDTLVHIFRFQGYEVDVHYLVNDIGKQIAILVLAVKDKKKVSFNELLGLYVEINKKAETDEAVEKKALELLNKLETGDKKVRKQFNDIVSICLEGQKRILGELGIEYDSFDLESEYLFNKKTDKILEQLEKTGKLFVDEEGRQVLKQEGYDLPIKSPVLVLTRADKTSLYPLRDIAYTIDKMKLNKENNILVLGEDQKTYFKQIDAALDILKMKSPKAIHYSFILLSDEKMSTRKGNVVLLEDFFNEAVSKANKALKERYGKEDIKKAKIIATAAIKYSILKVDADKNVLFDLNQALAFEGDTGPYLLYTYARANSILTKIKKTSKLKFPEKISDSEKSLIVALSRFPEVVNNATKTMAPHLVAGYAYQLAQTFNEFYHSCPVIGSEEEAFRVALVKSFLVVIKSCLGLLNIPVLEKM